MKALILILVGLIAGALGATMLANTLRERDAYARGLMDVMQHHYGGLREAVRNKRCEAQANGHALAQMRALAPDIGAAIYPDATPEAPFREFSGRFASTLDSAISAAATDCAALAPQVQAIGKVCDECHQQYR